VSADVVGYSRLMGRDEAGTLAALRAHRAELIDAKIAGHGGRIVKTMGDGLLLEFPSVVDATQCMVEIQSRMAERNQGVDEDRRIAFRIGVNLGDIIIEGEDILGDGVNIAARLQEIAQPGGVAISSRVHDDVRDRLDTGFTDTGEQSLKNIARPVRIWQWLPGASATAVSKTSDGPLPLPDKPSIAVLPFDNMSGDPEQEYFSDGITEDIITALSRVGWLFVIARNSTFTYKGQALDVTRIAGELGVRYIVEGSVRKAGNKVRITAQLVDGINGNHVWAERYDRELDDIFALQDEITENIVGRIDTELRAKEIDLARSKPPASLDAWDLYQRGLWHLYKITKEDNEEAHASFRKATERDPRFSLAYAGIAMSCYVEIFHGFSDDTDEWVNQGLVAGERAVSLDGAEYCNHAALGRVLMLSGESERAIAELERSVALNPSYAHGYLGLGIGLTWQGRAAEAIRNVDMAMRLSPNDPVLWGMQVSRAVACNKLGHYEEGEEWARKAVNARPDHFGGYSALVVALVEQDRTEEAQATIATLMRVKPDFTVSVYRRVRWFANSEYLELNIVALRKAGLPEK